MNDPYVSAYVALSIRILKVFTLNELMEHLNNAYPWLEFDRELILDRLSYLVSGEWLRFEEGKYKT